MILEPICGNMGVVPTSLAFMQMLREETHRIGALLIYDQVITGFRVGMEGAEALYPEIDPDLTCLGKIIGGGFPVGAFGGAQEIMDHLSPQGSVYQAGTLSGPPVTMAAGIAAIELLEREGFYEELERKTRLLTDPVEALLKKTSANACLNRVGSAFTLFFGRKSVNSYEEAKECNLAIFTDYFQTMFSKGIYVSPSQFEGNFVSNAHTEEHLIYTANQICEFISEHSRHF